MKASQLSFKKKTPAVPALYIYIFLKFGMRSVNSLHFKDFLNEIFAGNSINYNTRRSVFPNLNNFFCVKSRICLLVKPRI